MGKHKKRSREKKSKKEKRRSSSSDSSSENEWVEKSPPGTPPPIKTTPKFEKPEVRDDWLMSGVLASTSTADRKMSRELEKRKKRLEEPRDPSKCPRELNPYWKNGGTGLPTFQKPSDSLDYDNERREKKSYNWKLKESKSNESRIDIKKTTEKHNETAVETSKAVNKNISTLLDPNVIAAKLVKAEIMGNTKLIEELKLRLIEAKEAKSNEVESNNEILLTQTDSKGFSRPLRAEDEETGSRRKKKKVETYTGKERTKYYADDDKYSLKQMFEAEKFNSIDGANKEFAKMASGIKKNDDLEDIFVDNIRHEKCSKDVDKAINEQQRIAKSVDNCSQCMQSEYMLKHLIIDYNDNCYLSLPSFEPLTDGHCIISPIRHVTCSVQLDENEWTDINKLRNKLVQLFDKKDKCVIFFEIAKRLHKHPHMLLECVPVPKRKKELAPIYFKKAIEESEMEWSHNKKLISLKNRDVTRAVPKGLPYFFVSFGMEEGFAHVIEDQSMFPSNFAQEIIGGMLDIHHSKWRKPKREGFDDQKRRVTEFKNWWKT